MHKLKRVVIIEAIVIVILVAFIIYQNFSSIISNNHEGYCEKNYQNGAQCLLSSRVYTKIISPNSYLIMNFNPLKQDLQNYINQNKFNLSVYVVNLRDSVSFGINEDKSYPAASLNKLPIAVIILKKVQDGKLSLDTKLPITAADRDSSSGSLWAKKNIIMLSVRELLYYMLAESDNTATWVLQNPMTKEDIEQLTNYVGYYSNDIKSQELPLKTTEITPKSVANIFSSLYLSTVLNPEYSELILSDMTNSSFDIKKYAQLPEKVVISQKHGFHYLDDGSFYHSCGIIYVEDSRFFYCVMTQDISDEKAPEVIGTIVNKLYNFILEGRKVKDINI